MATSKAQQKAQNKWIAKAYDRINLTVPKGDKAVIKERLDSSPRRSAGRKHERVYQPRDLGDDGAGREAENGLTTAGNAV